MRTTTKVLKICIVVLAATTAPAASELREWAAHVGAFNATKRPVFAEAGFELRFPAPWAGADFTAGLAGTDDSSFWAWAGARYTFELDERWSFSLGLALSLYEEGDGKDLGGPIEFRSSYELSYLVGKRSRLGLVFYHLSNAGIYDLNPGANSVVLGWTRAAGVKPAPIPRPSRGARRFARSR